MSIRPLSHDAKAKRQSPLELLLFPDDMKDWERLRKAPQADLFLEISTQIVGKSNQEIHSCFDKHSDQLNLEFANWLSDWGKARLADGQRYLRIEELLNALNAIWDFPRGNRASNLEISLITNQLQLFFIDRKDAPRSWASIQNNLANAYNNRIRGDRVENLELAVTCCQSALEICPKQDFPIQWATTQNNLASVYRNRIKGDRSENLELAITFCENALEIRTKQEFPIDWATTQNNCAITYRQRIKGDRAENLELAIKYFENALEIRTKKDFPIQWAITQNNLAFVYRQRIKGDRAENLELAIKYCENALEIRTKQGLPIAWATTQNNLAIAYNDRIKGDPTENLELAIKCCKNALEIRTKQDFPTDWATTQNNLAAAYYKRIKGDCSENLELAIVCYQFALEVRTKQDLPIAWAMTQNNLAAAYYKRIKGDRSENLELAIECYENALPIIASSGFPQQLEALKNNLADAYLQRMSISSSENNSNERTNNTLKQLTQTCLDQGDWYKAALSLSLWSKALLSQKATTQAAQPLLQAISLDLQHNPQLIDTDLQELANLLTKLDWPPATLPTQWQTATNSFLTPSLQAQICLTTGIISIQQKYWYKGLDWLKACWEMHQQLDDLPGLAEVSYQLAIGHHIASNLSYAGIYYRDAQRLFQHLNNIRKVAFCHHGLGKLLLQLGKTELAIAEFDQALTIYNTIPEQPQVSSRIGDIHYYKRIITKMQDPSLTQQAL